MAEFPPNLSLLLTIPSKGSCFIIHFTSWHLNSMTTSVIWMEARANLPAGSRFYPFPPLTIKGNAVGLSHHGKITHTLVSLAWLHYLCAIFCPPLQPDTFQPLQTLFSGQLPAINPVILSLFSLVGIWLLIYGCLIFIDGRMQNLPAWLFILAAIGSGVIALIPYLALRQQNQSFSGEKDVWVTTLDSQKTGVILMISTVILVFYAFLWGDWSKFSQDFMTNRFVHGMSIAFCLFCALFPYPTLLQDDMARRGLSNDSRLGQIATWIPLFGPLTYLCLRPPLLAFRLGMAQR